jgi:hypothetical protein
MLRSEEGVRMRPQGVTAPTLLFVKRRTTEDVYVVALQRLSDKVKAILPES